MKIEKNIINILKFAFLVLVALTVSGIIIVGMYTSEKNKVAKILELQPLIDQKMNELRLAKTVDMHDSLSDELRHITESNNKTHFILLSDFGIDHNEITNLRQKVHEKEARSSWKKLSSTYLLDSKSETAIVKLFSHLRNAGRTLEEIGGSRAELDQMKLAGSKLAAQEWLEDLRRNPSEYRNILVAIYGEMKFGGFSLMDIGTTEEEIRSLIKKGYLTVAKKPLNKSGELP